MSELDLAEWLLNNSEGVKEKIIKTYKDCGLELPKDLLNSVIENQMIDLLKYEVSQHLDLNPEELQSIDKDYIENLLGKNYLNV